MTISYEIGDKLYMNITNKCPCSCTFCIRNNGDGAYGSDPLWLEHEPSMEEIKKSFGLQGDNLLRLRRTHQPPFRAYRNG